MKIIATKARRHQGFIFNKTFCVTLCLGVLVAIFMVACHEVARAFTRKRMKTNTNGLRSIEGPRAAWFHSRQSKFQSRFKSTIIENDGYLIKSIEYLLKNPVRARIVVNAEDYIWSSVGYYFSNKQTKIVDAEYVDQRRVIGFVKR